MTKAPPRERGRPARILSLGLPLSFPAMRHPATLSAGTAWARPKQSPGAVAGRPGSRRWARFCQCCAGGTPALPGVCGRDARAPGWASSHDVVISRSRYRRCIRARLVIEAGPSLFVFIRVHWWFVFKNDRQFLPRMIRTAGRGPGLPGIRAAGGFPRRHRFSSSSSDSFSKTRSAWLPSYTMPTWPSSTRLMLG